MVGPVFRGIVEVDYRIGADCFLDGWILCLDYDPLDPSHQNARHNSIKSEMRYHCTIRRPETLETIAMFDSQPLINSSSPES
jgi:hypothetical protein